MLEKLKANRSKITFVLSIVAGALLIPSLIARLDSPLTETGVVLLIEYLLLLTACGILILSQVTKKALLPVATVLFYGALAFLQVYNALSDSLSSYAMAGLYLAVLVLFFLPSCKKAFEITSLVAIAFFLAAALGGGVVNLSILLTSLLLAANRYFDIEKE